MNNSKVQSKNANQNRRRIQNKKVRKPKKLLIAIWTIILLGLAIGIFSLTTPTFNVTQIIVEGNNKVETDTILSLSGIKTNENMFRINKRKTTSKIEENKYIKSAKIERKLPGTVKIIVEERNVQYQINLINSFAYIDREGYILENSTVVAEVPLLSGLEIDENEMLNKERLDTEDLKKLNDTNKIIDAAKGVEIDSKITEIDTKYPENYTIYIENKTIQLGSITNLNNKMLYVDKMLENEAGKPGIFFVNGDINSGFNPFFRETIEKPENNDDNGNAEDEENTENIEEKESDSNE